MRRPPRDSVLLSLLASALLAFTLVAAVAGDAGASPPCLTCLLPSGTFCTVNSPSMSWTIPGGTYVATIGSLTVSGGSCTPIPADYFTTASATLGVTVQGVLSANGGPVTAFTAPGTLSIPSFYRMPPFFSSNDLLHINPGTLSFQGGNLPAGLSFSSCGDGPGSVDLSAPSSGCVQVSVITTGGFSLSTDGGATTHLPDFVEGSGRCKNVFINPTDLATPARATTWGQLRIRYR